MIYNGYKGYIERNGNWLIKHNYEEAYSFSEGLALVMKDKLYGFINQKGDLVIDTKFEDANYFMEGLAAVKKNDNWGYINQNGDWVMPPTYSGLGRYTKALSLEEQVEEFVTTMYSDWQLKGEFEKTSAYLTRVSEENRETRL